MSDSGPYESGARYSLRRRLLIWLMLPLIAIGVLALLDANRTARETANAVFDRVLSGSALAIAERVFVNEDGILDVDIPYVALDMLTSAAQDRVFYRVETADGALVTGYDRLSLDNLPDGPGVIASETLDARFRFADGAFRNAPIRLAIYESAASTGERSLPFRVAVAETTNARRDLAQNLLLRTALRQFLLIATAALVVWIGVTRALRPLGRLEAAIGRRSPDDLRPIAHDVPSEVGGLVDRINSFMQRLDQALEALRHFTGNASHQLRTPLSIIRAQLALAQRAQDPENARAALIICDEAAVDAERTLGQLLLMARIDATASRASIVESIDITEVARAATQNWVLPAAKAGFSLEFDVIGPTRIRGLAEPTLLREMLGNLIDNAIKHASNGTRIVVTVSRISKRPVITISDNGTGQAPMINAKRGRSSHTTNQPPPSSPESQGLGLAIVAEIARLFDAELHFGQTQHTKGSKAPQGLTVTITLQAAGSQHG